MEKEIDDLMSNIRGDKIDSNTKQYIIQETRNLEYGGQNQ